MYDTTGIDINVDIIMSKSNNDKYTGHHSKPYKQHFKNTTGGKKQTNSAKKNFTEKVADDELSVDNIDAVNNPSVDKDPDSESKSLLKASLAISIVVTLVYFIYSLVDEFKDGVYFDSDVTAASRYFEILVPCFAPTFLSIVLTMCYQHYRLHVYSGIKKGFELFLTILSSICLLSYAFYAVCDFEFKGFVAAAVLLIYYIIMCLFSHAHF